MLTSSDSTTVTTESNVYDPVTGFLQTATTGAVGDLDAWDAATTSYEYDTVGRVFKTTTGARATVTEYDPVGNITQTTITGSYTLDGSSEETESQTRTVYNSAGLAVSVTIENVGDDLTATTEYNDYGLPAVVVTPRGNAAGADPADYTTTMVYDHARQPIATTSPDSDFDYAGAASGIVANW